MSKKTSIILRDLLLEALIDYRGEDDLDDIFYFHMGELMKKTKEGFLDLKSETDINVKTNIIIRDLIIGFFERFRGDDPSTIEYNNISKFIEEIKDGSRDLKSLGIMENFFDDPPDTFEHFLASSYAKELCSLIPDATERATKLLTKVTDKRLDNVAEKYMEEASRCYIYGFFLSAAIMCRGAIEYSLKKYLGITESNEINERYSIHYLLNEAVKKPGPFTIEDKRIVLNINNGASDCIHGRSLIDSVKCLEYINNTKMVIEKLLR